MSVVNKEHIIEVRPDTIVGDAGEAKVSGGGLKNMRKVFDQDGMGG